MLRWTSKSSTNLAEDLVGRGFDVSSRTVLRLLHGLGYSLRTRGHPESPLRWTVTSTYELTRQLTAKGFKVSAELVRRLLGQMGYSLQATREAGRGGVSS